MDSKIDRRSFLGGSAAAAGALMGGLTTALKAAKTEAGSGPIAETTAGKIRGVMIDKVYAFKGVPYGASTAGAARFMPPAKPQPWTDLKDTIAFGHRSPQQPGKLEIPEVAETSGQGPMGEDCLVLNVWTNGLKGGKRPVMVWFHGGGFASGSGDYTIYDGANMARKRDVVTVTVNHRLNVFGYLYLAEVGGAKYAEATNPGHRDIVLALEWVRDNIANFGGDPNNVTIFGQSGGGGKVATLMAMPSAKGLFHKAICQSGASIKAVSAADATRATEALLAKLNLKHDQIDQLQNMPFDKLTSALAGVRGVGSGPVVDGKTLLHDPFDPGAPEESANIPLLIGTVEEEVNFFPTTQLDPIDDADLHKRVKQTTRADDATVDKLIAVYKKGRPNKSNVEIFQIISTDSGFATSVHTEAERKAAQGKAPVYKYYFTWQSPVRDGKLRSYHTLDIPFVLENVDNGKTMTGTGQDRYALSDKMSAAWAAFARTGVPSAKGLPHWTAYTNDQRATMIFDNECKLVNDPFKEERLAIAALPKAGPGRA